MAALRMRTRTRRHWELMAARAVLMWPQDCAKILAGDHMASSKIEVVMRSLGLNARVKTNRIRFVNALKKGAESHATTQAKAGAQVAQHSVPRAVG
jgi:hypothetical protein